MAWSPLWVQVFRAVQRYRLPPGTALVLKKSSPEVHVAGNAVPAFTGLVVIAAVKSTFFSLRPQIHLRLGWQATARKHEHADKKGCGRRNSKFDHRLPT